MQSHLQKIVPRSSVNFFIRREYSPHSIIFDFQLLFGHLITNDRLIPSKPLTMNTQDANNILSLSTCSRRFTLLPIAKSLSSTTSTNQTLLTKGNLFKANLEHQANHENFDQDSNSTAFRPLTSNVAEVATYYSKWFQNMVKQ